MKIYIGKILKGIPYFPILYSNLGGQKDHGFLFWDKNFFCQKPFFDLVSRPEEADFLMFPHNYPLIKNNKEYINEMIILSKKYHKKIIVFIYGDSSDNLEIEDVIIFRTSQYKFQKKDNEIIIPPFFDDLSKRKKSFLQEKTNQPVIGFCGFVGVGGWQKKIKFLIKSIFIYPLVYRPGVYFRKRAIKILKKSKLIKTNFILRNFYSGNLKTIKIPSEIARNEYVDNILNSDLVLAPKGDGNFSLRFFEALSLNRIPILIDTDCVLPLEDIINYNDCILRINYKKLNNLDKIIFDFYRQLSKKDWENRQNLAREIFEKYLNVNNFYQLFFSDGGFLKKNYLSV